MAQQHKRQPEASDAETLRGHVALKGFFNICREWGCSQDEMMQMLGGVSRSTLAKYQKLPYVKLSRDTLERISYVMGIYKSLRVMYPTAERANRRVRLATSEVPFSGTSALEFMARGSMKHLMQARRYFDAKRGWA
ncbi:MAG: antitoxin Xre-like helix-turn-helix domain-containing protein [Pseudomonadota bacterium]|nr:antitoxin Xre-like helix-turn-helix domain-containing protein [Pseudomonadota bacterium]